MVKSSQELEARKAKELYVQQNYVADEAAENARKDWAAALRIARRIVADALRHSDYLRDPAAALRQNGKHMLAFRHMIAPPISQDQFRLLCPIWPKSTEKSERSINAEKADEIANALLGWFDPNLARWIDEDRLPSRKEIRSLLDKVAGHIATKQIDTAKRGRLSARQESAVVKLLTDAGWTQLQSKMIDDQGDVPTKHFMHKTRFSAGISGHHEVDIACGLSGRYVLAMECKVSNDETNSVKRINDVLKKAEAWRIGWGRGIETAALLEGVIKPSDVQRLTEGGVHVFWSHDLDAFGAWLAKKIED